MIKYIVRYEIALHLDYRRRVPAGAIWALFGSWQLHWKIVEVAGYEESRAARSLIAEYADCVLSAGLEATRRERQAARERQEAWDKEREQEADLAAEAASWDPDEMNAPGTWDPNESKIDPQLEKGSPPAHAEGKLASPELGLEKAEAGGRIDHGNWELRQRDRLRTNVVLLRRRLSWSQQKLADEAGLSLRTIMNLESIGHEAWPDRKALTKICIASRKELNLKSFEAQDLTGPSEQILALIDKDKGERKPK